MRCYIWRRWVMGSGVQCGVRGLTAVRLLVRVLEPVKTDRKVFHRKSTPWQALQSVCTVSRVGLLPTMSRATI